MMPEPIAPGEDAHWCPRAPSVRTCLAVCVLLVTYCVIGGLLFYTLEGDLAADTGAAVDAAASAALTDSHDLRAITVARLWAITEDLNILYKENWTSLAARELMQFQRDLTDNMRIRRDEHRWTLASSCLYALTLITTIGHGGVTPRSSVGKLVAVAYACVGIPLVMLYLSAVGDTLAMAVRTGWSRCIQQRSATRSPPRKTPFQAAVDLTWRTPRSHCNGHSRMPVLIGVTLTALYVVMGAFIFRHTERWSLAEGCFFSFSALATVGFGALRPGTGGGAGGVVCGGYLLVGIAVVAMCFSLARGGGGAVQ